MTVRRVWAPNAELVEIEVGDERRAMTPAGRGWWRTDSDHLPPGSDYAYRLDGDGPFPDPRSEWQPAGVHGPSRIVDHAAFRWTDAGWRAAPLASGIVYELHVGTFSGEGTFEAAIPHLDHLVDLGVTHVELMPVAEFSGDRGWGYDGVDLFAPHHAYGGPTGLKRLVDACHARRLAVILDVVYNHLGPEGNYLSRFGPFFTDRHRTPWGAAVNFDDRGSDEVRRFFCDNALMWLRDYHVDGLRVDAVHAIHDASARKILEQLVDEVRRLEVELGRQLTVIAESDLNDPTLVRPVEAGGYGLDAAWSDDFHHALHAVLTGERGGYYADFGSLHHLARALEGVYVYRGDWSPARGRSHGRPATGVPAHRFLGYLQTHDQVGNRARGERIGQLVGIDRLKVGAAVVLTAPFVPMLFAGEEWAASTPFQYFTAHQSPELADAVRRGRRAEFAAFGWDPSAIPDPQDRETFQRSKLRWEEREQGEHAEMLDWHRRLIALRRSTPALLDPRLDEVRCSFDEQAGWFRIDRGAITIGFNLGAAPATMPLRGRLLLASEPSIALEDGGLHLPPDRVAVVERG